MYKIGYTTGVFDMFHIGHLNIIKRAKEQCDFLIVGVSVDELVMEYKNKTPVIPYEQRAEIIKSLKYVDKVVPQYTMNKMDAWHELHFDALFHGDDWKNTDTYKKIEENLISVGVDLVYLPYTKNISSTIIREYANDKVNEA